MKVVINGIEYNPKPLHGESITSYYHKGTMLSNVRFPRLYTHGVVIDGYMVAFISPAVISWITAIVIVPVIVVTLLIVLLGKVAKDTGIVSEIFSEETTVDTGVVTVESNDSPTVMSYNSYMIYEDGTVDVLFQNGDYEATIEVIGSDVSSELVTVESNAQCRVLPVTLNTEADLFNATLVVKQVDSDTLEYPVTIERFHYQNYGDVTFKDEEVLYE